MSVPTLLMMVKQTAKNQKMHRTDKAIYHFQNIDSFGQRNNQNQFYYIQSKTTNKKSHLLIQLIACLKCPLTMKIASQYYKLFQH